MSGKDLREIVEAVLERLASEAPEAACLWWDAAPAPCTDCQDVMPLYGVPCTDGPGCSDVVALYAVPNPSPNPVPLYGVTPNPGP